MFFHFLKIIFDIKTIQNIQIILNFNKKKNFQIFLGTRVEPRSQTLALYPKTLKL